MSIIKAKEKSNKIHENIIGKIIYGFLLFAPLLMILTTSCYAIFNKNAHESYYGKSINETIYEEITQTNQLKVGQTYHYERPLEHKTLTNSSSYYLKFNNLRNLNSTFTQTIDTNTFDAMRMSDYTNNYLILLDSTTNTAIYTINLTTYNISFDFDFVDYTYTTANTLTDYFDGTLTKAVSNKYRYLDNNFDYGIYKTEQSQYFNWSKNTALYTGLRATCQSLGIENTFTPMLMAYWLLISIIYFIFDIGLIMVHLVHRKIHEFTESV